MAKALEGKVVLITGASRGIGYATAKAFGLAGAHVIAIARTVGGLEDLDDEIKAGGGSTTLVPLDLKDGDGIDRMGKALYERFGKLDAFIGNAGQLGVITPISHLDPKIFDDVMAINVTANWRLLRSLDPLLKAADSGRVMMISSNAVRNRRPFWGAYAASKSALEALTVVYAKENDHSSVKTLLINPGAMRTAMRAKAVPGEDPETLPTPADLAPHLVAFAAERDFENGVLWDFRTDTFQNV